MGTYPQLTAFFTSAAIFVSSAGVNFVTAKATGHMVPSSRFASCWKPNVAYLVLNLAALWKKQTIFPSLAYAGIPYQTLGESWGVGFDNLMEPLGYDAIRFRHLGNRREHVASLVRLVRAQTGALALRRRTRFWCLRFLCLIFARHDNFSALVIFTPCVGISFTTLEFLNVHEQSLH